MTTPVVHLPEHLLQQIIDHCLDELPNEACGLVAVDGDVCTKVYPTPNELRSPVAYTVPPTDHMAALTDAEKSGWALGGVFHSHPQGSPELSKTDIRNALDKRWTYFVVGLAGRPTTRAWRVTDAGPTEVAIATSRKD